MSTHILLAPGFLNTLGLWRRLPLMEDSSKTLSFSGGMGLFMIWVPSRFGGILEVGCTQSGAKIHVSRNGVAAKDPAGNEPPFASKVVCAVPPGEFGWFGAAVFGVSGSFDMWATFVETGLSRETNDENAEPLIPWNFWYFPNAASRKESSAWGSSTLHPCEHYETAFHKTGVLAWEKANHNDPDGTAAAWEGHCHNSAFAAIYFTTPPPAGKSVNGTLITCEEIKFLATEFVGQKKVRDATWMLPGANRSGPFHETKPSDDPKLFGKEIGNFHKAMRDALLVDRMAVVMDLRHSRGVDHSEVWNQAVYRYEAHYWETLPHNDWLDIQARTHLNANEDRLKDDRSSSGVPAKIVNGPKPGGMPHSAEPDAAAIRRDQTLRYHVKFKDDGDIDSSNPINEWLSVKLDGASPELHAPRFIMSPKKPTGNSVPDGNIKIDPADVLAVLPLRERFK